MLQVVDLALAKPAAVRALSAKGFDVTTHGVLVEARSSILLASLQAEMEATEAASAQDQGAQDSMTKVSAPWFKDVPANLTASFAPEANADTMQEAILRLVKKRFSNLILMPIDQVDENKPLPDFGVDSMIASEFRSWFWAVFRVDLPFLDIMSPQKKLATLAGFVEEKIVQVSAK
ncbi:hypothetical protein ONZ43_g6232 [Nemania bipapillata]|uniref:Uncharacterized protein n=1 Tax=Nemania bipapillata TaxID=110536 RepID=A0ACC2I1U6_9PEZI|nr:hypothetical protein ONZ43_g6232 [Nemania bipapillata]